MLTTPIRPPPRPLGFCERYWGGLSLLIGCALIVGSYFYAVLVCIVTTKEVISFVAMSTFLLADLILLGWSYFETHWTRPPEIPDRFRFTVQEWAVLEAAEFRPNEIGHALNVMAAARGIRTRTHSGQVNYCALCRLLKPDRTHHCSSCRRCVARMDHHCPYFANCIHFSNFKSFLLTLFYSTIGAVYVIVSTVIYVLASGTNLNVLKGNVVAIALLAVMGVSCCLIALIVGGFFITSLNHAMHNCTTLEYIGGTVVFAGGSKETYDLGSACTNLKHQFGPVITAWFLPIRSAPGDGMSFPVRSDLESAGPLSEVKTDS